MNYYICDLNYVCLNYSMSSQTIPVINLNGDNIEHVFAGVPYVDAGATAFDQFQGDITDQIVVNNPVNTGKPGKYTVTYNVTDENGVKAEQVFRTVVVVVVDNSRPVIILNGDNPALVEINSRYVDEGATAVDPVQGDLTAQIVVNNPVNTHVVPATPYKMIYTVKNERGQTAVATREVIVLKAPTITLHGPKVIEIDVFQQLVLPGASGSDSYYGKLTNDIVIVNPVNMNIPGTYDITYNLTNPAQISAKEQIRTVRVIDPYYPKITLNGLNPYNIAATSNSYRDPGAIASDRIYGNLTNDIVVTENVDLGTPGLYEVTYSVTNEDGLKGESTRTVRVIDTSKADHTMLESAGTHGVTLSESFKKSSKAYLGIADPSQNPYLSLIDVTSKVIVDMGDTSSFILQNGDTNKWHGYDVAHGKRKALLLFDQQ